MLKIKIILILIIGCFSLISARIHHLSLKVKQNTKYNSNLI